MKARPTSTDGPVFNSPEEKTIVSRTSRRAESGRASTARDPNFPGRRSSPEGSPADATTTSQREGFPPPPCPGEAMPGGHGQGGRSALMAPPANFIFFLFFFF